MKNNQSAMLVTKSNGIATVTINRPEKLNALGEEGVNELTKAMKLIRSDGHIRAIILTGAGRAFCAGADRSSTIFRKNSPTEFWDFMQKVSDAVITLRSMPQPLIAAVNGPAVGGGCNFALACDIIIASEAATFSQIYSLIGIHPDAGGTYLLPRLVGTAKACELLFTGKTITAAEAYEMGLINRVVPADQLEDSTRELATTIANRSPLAIRMIKASIYQGAETNLAAALEQEAKALSILLFTEDSKEAMAALAENRAPSFKNK